MALRTRRRTDLSETNWIDNTAVHGLGRSEAVVRRRYDATPGEIAWTLRNPAVIVAIIGVRSAQQASGIAGAADVQLTGHEMSDIEQALRRQAAKP